MACCNMGLAKSLWQKSRDDKPVSKLVSIIGFHGQGNFGDELMLLGMAHWLKAQGHTVVCQAAWSDQHRQRMLDYYRDWPIDDVKTLDDRDFAQSVDFMLVGAGGYAWNLAPMTMLGDGRVAIIGQTFHASWFDARIYALTLPLLRRVTVVTRDFQSAKLLRSHGIEPIEGVDPAFLVEPPAVEPLDNATIFVREAWANNDGGLTRRERIDRYVKASRALCDARMAFSEASCCQADTNWCRDNGIGASEPLPPCDLLHLIAASERVISIDRLHPCVAAKLCGVPYESISTKPNCKLVWQEEVSRRYSTEELRQRANWMMEQLEI